MPPDCNAFDLDTVSDVVITIKYTSRESGEILKNAAKKSLQEAIADADQVPVSRLFSLRHEFPSEWQRLFSVGDSNGDHVQVFALTKNRFPFLFQSKNITITILKVDLYVLRKGDAENPEFPQMAITVPEGTTPVNLAEGSTCRPDAGQYFEEEVEVKLEERDSRWTFTIPKNSVVDFQKTVQDILLVCHYTVRDRN